jgi:hypothetical protein
MPDKRIALVTGANQGVGLQMAKIPFSRPHACKNSAGQTMGFLKGQQLLFGSPVLRALFPYWRTILVYGFQNLNATIWCNR